MAGETAVRKLSPEFWAIVWSTIILLMALIGLAALILALGESVREDIRAVGAGLGDVETRSKASEGGLCAGRFWTLLETRASCRVRNR